MKEIKKCQEKDFEPQIDSSQHYTEFLGGLRLEKKGDLSYSNGFENESIDDYFTSIQMLSNSIILKKYKIRAKKSNCSYVKLYQEELISDEVYDLIEEFRVNRNIIHYNAYESSLISEEDINDLVKKVKGIINLLKKLYEVM